MASEDGDDDGSVMPDSPLERRLRHLRLYECRIPAPVVVPSELSAALASLSGVVDPPVTPTSNRRRRTRARAPSTAAEAARAGGGGGRRAKRRRVPGVRDAPEGSSDSSLPPAILEDIFAADTDGSTDSGAEQLDEGPRALQLIEYYKKRIVRVLVSAIDDAVPSDDSAGTLFRVVSVADGAAVLLSEGERAYVSWAWLENDAVSYLCTCGGKGGAEAVQLRAWLGSSSSCCHARGLKASFEELATSGGLPSDVALLQHYPKLDNASSPPAAECQVFYATKTAKRKGVFAVLFESTWAAVVIRNKLNKTRSRKRVQRRPACTLLSCQKDHWTCPHAAATAVWCADMRLAAAAGGFDDPLKNVLLPTAPPVSQPGRSAAAQAAEWAAFADESRGRCSRNLLPCAGEVSDCLLFDQLADAGREGEAPSVLPHVLCEAVCFSCGAAYNNMGIKNTGAIIHTLRGRVAVTLRRWTCGCGEMVPYDGAHDGLFASSKETVFTRVFLDVMTQMVFTGHGTLSSAASVMCFLLESTKSFSGSSSSLARQTLITSVHRYSRTLIVPASLFRCKKCRKRGERPYLAIIADGQVLSILRNQSQPLVRSTQDLVGVALDAGHGACLASAPMRSAIRKRMTAEKQAVVRITKDEKATLERLSEELAVEPEPHTVGAIASNPNNLSWAAAFLFFSFYTNEVTDVNPAAADETAEELDAPDLDNHDGSAPAVEQGAAAGDDAPPIPGGGGGAAAPAAGQLGALFCVSRQVDGAVGEGLSVTETRERWRVVRRFLLTFLGHPVIGAFVGLPRKRIKRLAKKLALGVPVDGWKPYATAVESVGIVWPFLRLIGMSDGVDPLMTRAIGEVLLFTCDVDAHWETLWRTQVQAVPGAAAFQEQWLRTSPEKYSEWAATREAPLPASSPLLCSDFSKVRGMAQLREVLSGQVWPDLDPVRPFITDSKAEAVNASRAERVKAGRDALVDMMNKELGADDCRHAFLLSQTFMPGVENFLCPCGLLIGFDFLDRAESPAHVLASIVQRFTLLPLVVYFDTACQMARNASRRLPWLVNRSSMAASIDRAHRIKNQHGCSPVYDADAYPSRSVRHRTACAETRHSINKALKAHLVHLRQDHFMVQMRLLGAFVNLRVKMRHELGRETNHRPVSAFFHRNVQTYCDRRSCTCDHGRRQAAQAAAAAAAAAAANAAAVDAAATDELIADDNGAPAPVAVGAANNGAVATGAANAAPAAAGAANTGPAAAGAAIIPPAALAPANAAPVAPGAAVAAPVAEAMHVVVDAALQLYRTVKGAVVAAVAPAVSAAAASAVDDAASRAAAAVGTLIGAAGGQAAVRAAYESAAGAGSRLSCAAVGRAAGDAAGYAAALSPVQTALSGTVGAAVQVAVQDATRASIAAPSIVAGLAAGSAAGHAAGVAAVRAAGLQPPAAAFAVDGGEGEEDGRPAIGQAAVRAALRGALLAAGIVVKPEPDVEVKVDYGREGGGEGDVDEGGGEGEGDGGGGEVYEGEGGSQGDGDGGDGEDVVDLPVGVVVDDSSSSELSSLSVVSDDVSDSDDA